MRARPLAAVPAPAPALPPLPAAAPRMDVKFPILGFLMDREMTGYDLKRRFQDPVGYFYRASDGSLYPALKKLARDGLVTVRVERRGRRTRKVYAITARGRERFLRILREPAQPVFVFDEAQVKIYFSHHDPAAGIEHMDRMRREDANDAAGLARLNAAMRASDSDPFRRMVVALAAALVAAKADVSARLAGELRRELDSIRRRPRAHRGYNGLMAD
jgi:DNA-binding PadR family transcriptional regulator